MRTEIYIPEEKGIIFNNQIISGIKITRLDDGGLSFELILDDIPHKDNILNFHTFKRQRENIRKAYYSKPPTK